MEQQFLNNQNQAFLQLRYEPENNWIYANWIGYISEISIKTGTEAILKLLEQTHCAFLLNDNRKVQGPWDKSNCYLQQAVIPSAIELGLKCMAHVLSPAISGALSAQDLHRRVEGQIEMKLFGEMKDARSWLCSRQQVLSERH